VAGWVSVASIEIIWLISEFFNGFVHWVEVAFVFVAIAFPHNEGGGFGISHGTCEGVWCGLAWAFGSETHSLSVFEISDFVVDDLVDFTGGSVRKSHGEACGGNIKDLLSFVWPCEGHVRVTEKHVEFSHYELALRLFFDHEASPGSEQVNWSNLTARSVACLVDHTRLVLLALE